MSSEINGAWSNLKPVKSLLLDIFVQHLNRLFHAVRVKSVCSLTHEQWNTLYVSPYEWQSPHLVLQVPLAERQRQLFWKETKGKLHPANPSVRKEETAKTTGWGPKVSQPGHMLLGCGHSPLHPDPLRTFTSWCMGWRPLQALTKQALLVYVAFGLGAVAKKIIVCCKHLATIPSAWPSRNHSQGGRVHLGLGTSLSRTTGSHLDALPVISSPELQKLLRKSRSCAWWVQLHTFHGMDFMPQPGWNKYESFLLPCISKVTQLPPVPSLYCFITSNVRADPFSNMQASCQK